VIAVEDGLRDFPAGEVIVVARLEPARAGSSRT
jgi:hypothetical protein